ncbi:alpha/beta-hydrolase [Stereum hirsutum FP-91666 SS1]|uniref:alpha/beta-hydrolase n=1 Tax=Stereum hirsutum (strain FP-91666) TaxID=721885 RepID=UPI0004449D56|nr:alpha/beta-hydrolase [Stereum hirsutum FP-91666 SS1]EIM85476.1 alpha/beta-hydrolase [Stereum hirsutum FP-91666 SS1]
MALNTLVDRYGRYTVDIASTASSFGFAAAKAGTRLGFGITREIASGAAGLTGSVLDYALFGGRANTGATFSSTIASAISAIEQLTLLPILLGESLTSASIVAAYGSINALAAIFPGSDEASFSLASFITLVRKEWNDPVLGEHLPEERYGVGEVAQALVAWGALQGVTHDWQVAKWMKALKEVPFHDESEEGGQHAEREARKRTESKVSVMSDVTSGFGGHQTQIITADITEVDELQPTAKPLLNLKPFPSLPPQSRTGGKPLRVSNKDLKHTLRRLSKMVLAGYGGASLLFFGVSPVPNANPSSAPTDATHHPAEAATLTQAVDASEVEASKLDGEASMPSPSPSPSPSPAGISAPQAGAGYSWWNVLLGRHDREIFMGYATTGHPSPSSPSSSSSSSSSPSSSSSSPAAAGAGGAAADGARPMSAVIGDEHRMPRFWVLTDHARRQIVLVFRGTMSLNELAVDLTCEPEEFEPAREEGEGRGFSAGAGSGGYGYGSRAYQQKDRTQQGAGEETEVGEGEETETEGGETETEEDYMTARAESDGEGMPGLFPFPSVHVSASSPTSTSTSPTSSRRQPSVTHSRQPSVTHSRPPSVINSRMRTGSFVSLASFTTYTDGENVRPRYQVHGGMLRMARAMGGKGKPVHVAVREALRRNLGFELVMCGHSLGSGVAALLAMSWADPTTCLTVKASGLPVGRRVSVFCFGPRCLTDPRLSALASNLVTSFVYSHDVVSRLSLGSIRDITRAAAWLCNANNASTSSLNNANPSSPSPSNANANTNVHPNSDSDSEDPSTMNRNAGYTSITRAALRWNTGFGSPEDPGWFLSIRKTLEANMMCGEMYPPGRVLWAVRDGDLRGMGAVAGMGMGVGEQDKGVGRGGAGKGKGGKGKDRLRLFEVLDVEKVFSQIVFARDMLSSHLPHQYDRVLEELL